MSARTVSLAVVVSFFLALMPIAPVAAQPAAADDQNTQTSKLLEVLKVGQIAKDVEFQPVRGDAKIKLGELTKDGPVVLVVLRGFPGYQCPICTRQVAELRRSAEDFVKFDAKVVLVYPGPGPAESLKQKAVEFLAGSELPKPFLFMVDPEYAFINLYQLRWNASRETAYPTTLVLDTTRVVRFRTISETHGGRAATKDVLAALAGLQKPAASAATATGAGNEN